MKQPNNPKQKEKDKCTRIIEWEERDGILAEAIEEKIVQLKEKLTADCCEDDLCTIEEIFTLYHLWSDIKMLDSYEVTFILKRNE